MLLADRDKYGNNKELPDAIAKEIAEFVCAKVCGRPNAKERGGHAMHINVFDADTLRDAQAHPEKYSDLQIRVCGWNVLWSNISKAEQDGFIRQAEALA